MGLKCACVLHVWQYATVDRGLPSSGAVNTLWTMMCLPLVLCVCLRNAALTMDVDGKIRLFECISSARQSKAVAVVRVGLFGRF